MPRNGVVTADLRRAGAGHVGHSCALRADEPGEMVLGGSSPYGRGLLAEAHISKVGFRLFIYAREPP